MAGLGALFSPKRRKNSRSCGGTRSRRCDSLSWPSSSSDVAVLSTLTFTDTTAGFTWSTTSAKDGKLGDGLTVIGWV
jgi:hypothetical protein